MMLLKTSLKVHRLWAPNYSSPQYLDAKDVKPTERNGKIRSTDGSRIADAWNNEDSTDLAMVAQEIANSYKSTFYRNDPKKTTWALIIKNSNY